jgi:hypothetical protein
MRIIINPLPCKREFFLALCVSVFLLHIWSIVTYLYTVPGLLLSRSQAIANLLNRWQVNYISIIMILLSIILIGLSYTFTFSRRWIKNRPWLRQAFSFFADRISVLASLFIILEIISLVVIVLRNLG